MAAPLALLPARIRRSYESRVMVCLAGNIGEALHSHREPELPTQVGSSGPEAGKSETPIIPLPVQEREALDVAVARDTVQSDMGKALETLTALHFGDDEQAVAHGRLLSMQTELLLSGRTPTRMILTLAGNSWRTRHCPRGSGRQY